jgi:hypothetical protein
MEVDTNGKPLNKPMNHDRVIFGLLVAFHAALVWAALDRVQTAVFAGPSGAPTVFLEVQPAAAVENSRR